LLFNEKTNDFAKLIESKSKNLIKNTKLLQYLPKYYTFQDLKENFLIEAIKWLTTYMKRMLDWQSHSAKLLTYLDRILKNVIYSFLNKKSEYAFWDLVVYWNSSDSDNEDINFEDTLKAKENRYLGKTDDNWIEKEERWLFWVVKFKSINDIWLRKLEKKLTFFWLKNTEIKLPLSWFYMYNAWKLEYKIIEDVVMTIHFYLYSKIIDKIQEYNLIYSQYLELGDNELKEILIEKEQQIKNEIRNILFNWLEEELIWEDKFINLFIDVIEYDDWNKTELNFINIYELIKTNLFWWDTEKINKVLEILLKILRNEKFKKLVLESFEWIFLSTEKTKQKNWLRKYYFLKNKTKIYQSILLLTWYKHNIKIWYYLLWEEIKNFSETFEKKYKIKIWRKKIRIAKKFFEKKINELGFKSQLELAQEYLKIKEMLNFLFNEKTKIVKIINQQNLLNIT